MAYVTVFNKKNWCLKNCYTSLKSANQLLDCVAKTAVYGVTISDGHILRDSIIKMQQIHARLSKPRSLPLLSSSSAGRTSRVFQFYNRIEETNASGRLQKLRIKNAPYWKSRQQASGDELHSQLKILPPQLSFYLNMRLHSVSKSG